MFNSTSTQVFTASFLNMLLTWNTLDPMSPRVARNNAIYAPSNRNPYIDNPEYVQEFGIQQRILKHQVHPTIIASGTTKLVLSILDRVYGYY
jgi:hypothetical protein